MVEKMKIKASKKIDNYFELTRELNKAEELESNGDINCNWSSWNNPQKLGKETGKNRCRKRNRDYQN